MPETARAPLITCEHARNAIPPVWRGWFRGAIADLNSHRGYDPGALELATAVAARLRAPLHAGSVSRLLVELNRSEHHPALWSEYSRALVPEDQEVVLNRHYRPFRSCIREWIGERVRCRQPVIHLSVHTFTPVLDGQVRGVEIGLLYDPTRPGEKEFCRHWRQRLVRESPDWRVRMNQPYRGRADGHTTALRRLFSATDYLGIELEVNQAFVVGPRAAWRRCIRILAETLAETVRC